MRASVVSLQARSSHHLLLTRFFLFQGKYATKRYADPRQVELCHYLGHIRDVPDSWAAVSTCDGGVRGAVFDGRELHHIENQENIHFIYRHNEHISFANATDDNKSFRFKRAVSNEKNRRPPPRSESKSKIKGPWNADKRSRYVELLLVIDHQEFLEHGQDLPKIFRICKDVANVMNALYSPLNIYIGLVGIVVWTEYDEIALSSNGDTTLTNFLHYRRERLVKDHPNDNAQLLTATQFDGGVVGKALKGPMCTFEFSGGVSTWHSDAIGLVATTVAHEMGHNFGMEHDSDDCQCPDDRCIMAPASSALKPTFWSSCSLEYLALAFEHGMDYCLRNKPVALFGSPVCGNGFVEEGEQCDCGLPDHCDNPCCDPTSCRLYANATCATGECCDLSTCRPKSPGSECRRASHECDLPEYCTGDSEFCPNDVFMVDGTPCKVGQAFCYSGTCRTHSDQCKLLWGPSGRQSEGECYEQNRKGSRHGNCGYDRLNSSYVECQKEDVRCGMLHCTHLNERLEFGMESVAILSHSFINSGGRIIPCRTALVDLGLNDVDPGLAPEGARCGDGKLCVNQKCMSVASLKIGPASCPGGCGGHGVCNSRGHCHCDAGYDPPLCVSAGSGGSVDSGPATGPSDGSTVGEVLAAAAIAVVSLLALLFLLVFIRSRGDMRRFLEKARDRQVEKKRRGSIDTGTGTPAGGGASNSASNSPTHALLPHVDTVTSSLSQDKQGSNGEPLPTVECRIQEKSSSRQWFSKKHSAADIEGRGESKVGFMQSLARSITFPSSIRAKDKAAKYEIKVEHQQPKTEESSPMGEESAVTTSKETDISVPVAPAESVVVMVSPKQQKQTTTLPTTTTAASPTALDFRNNPKLAFPHSSSFTESGSLKFTSFMPSSSSFTVSTTAPVTSHAKAKPPPVPKKPSMLMSTNEPTTSTTTAATMSSVAIVSPVMASTKALQSPFFKKASTTTTTTPTTSTTSSSSPQALTKTSTLPSNLSSASVSGPLPKSSTLPLNTPASMRPEISKPVLQTATPSAASLIEKAPSTGVSQSSILSRPERPEKRDRSSRGVVFCDPLTLPSPTNPNNPPIIHQPLTAALPKTSAVTSTSPPLPQSKSTPTTIVTPTWSTEPRPLTSDAVVCHIDESDEKSGSTELAPIASPERDNDTPATTVAVEKASDTTKLTKKEDPATSQNPARKSFRNLEISSPILQSSVNLKTKLVPVCSVEASPRSSASTSPVPVRSAPPPPVAPRGRPRVAARKPSHQSQDQQQKPQQQESPPKLQPQSQPHPSPTSQSLPQRQASLNEKDTYSSRKVPWRLGRFGKQASLSTTETSFSVKEPSIESDAKASPLQHTASLNTGSITAPKRPASIAASRPVRPSAPPPKPPPAAGSSSTSSSKVTTAPDLSSEKHVYDEPPPDDSHIYDTIKERSPPKEGESQAAQRRPTSITLPEASSVTSPSTEDEFMTPTTSPLFSRKKSPDSVSTASSSEGDLMKEILKEMVDTHQDDSVYNTLMRKKKGKDKREK